MAQVANTFSTYDAALGIREELSDMIFNIDPQETPLISMAGRTPVNHTYFEWLNDSLAAASGSNFAVEGDEFTFTAPIPRVRLANSTAISTKRVIVSGTQRAVNNAGVADELGYQVAKQGKELRRDMEVILCGPQAAVLGNDTTARETAGFEAFIRTNDSRGATGAEATLSAAPNGHPSVDVVDGTQRAYTETIHKAVNQLCYASGGEPDTVIVGPFNKGVSSGFAGIAAQRYMAPGSGQSTIVGAADVYLGDFGTTRFVPSRFSRDRSALYVDKRYISLAMLRPFELMELAKTGDADKRALVVEYGLKVDIEKAHGIAADLLTS